MRLRAIMKVEYVQGSLDDARTVLSLLKDVFQPSGIRVQVNPPHHDNADSKTSEINNENIDIYDLSDGELSESENEDVDEDEIIMVTGRRLRPRPIENGQGWDSSEETDFEWEPPANKSVNVKSEPKDEEDDSE